MNWKTYKLSNLLWVTMLCVAAFALGCSNTTEKSDAASQDNMTPEEKVIAEERQSAIADGAEFYNSYCTMCHGEDGKGEGSMAEKLETPIPDLTKITKRYDGTFPTELMADIVAGRKELAGHGDGEMPDWWTTFKKSENITDEVVIQGKIENIVAYLKSIQEN